MRLIRKASGQTLAGDLRAARGPLQRLRGLMGKSAMPGDGLLIAPADSIHTFFMRMPIDLIFLARDGRVLKTCPAVPPWRVRLAPRGARLVLEMSSGFIARHAIRPGDGLIVTDPAAGSGRMSI